MSQSTNDVYPTALKLAAYAGIMRLVDAMAVLRQCVRGEGRRVQGRPQDGPHPVAGRGADDARPGILDLRGDARRGRAAARRRPSLLICEINMGATAIGTGINAHPDYAGAGLPASARDHRHSAGDRGEPGRGDPGLRRVRPALRRAQARRGQAVEDLQRSAAAVVGPARRAGRDQSAADAGRLVASCRARSTR